MHEHLISAQTVHKFDGASYFFIGNLGPIMFANLLADARDASEPTDKQTDR